MIRQYKFRLPTKLDLGTSATVRYRNNNGVRDTPYALTKIEQMIRKAKLELSFNFEGHGKSESHTI